ncbi:uncharacterized protein LOC122461267 [Dermochelys coriacea]|uniref:uncharacterized protein LOC122461267 n=1 Tax=Dermochelys coriacea TaxID=27794 RepID=UPI001CAA182C|nr:uncharacterized protein LOC122461267 [Dermochelys coriacea]XP_043376225.1 uncharacterized protein LOC122461267 [Dermochelys coriacea]
MAPRIRLTISKPLPTICETQEEILEDVTSNAKGFGSFSIDSDSCSSDDYLQSICHLARPTFPVFSENPYAFQDKKVLETLQRMSWFPKLEVAQQVIPKYKLTNIFSDMMSLEKVSLVLDNAKLYPCTRADPLEQLYAQAEKTRHYRVSVYGESSSMDDSQHSHFSSCDTRRGGEIHPSTSQEKMTEKQDLAGVFSFPRLPSPRPIERENSCPEQTCLKSSKIMAVSENDQTQKENCTIFIDGKRLWPHPPREKLQGNKVLSCPLRRQCAVFKTRGGTEKEELKSSSYNKIVKGDVLNKQSYPQCFHVDKKAMIHSWISECKCAWKGAKVKACLLPAIAEI